MKCVILGIFSEPYIILLFHIEMMEEKRLSDGPVMMIVMGRVLNDENMSETLRSNPDHK